MTLQSCIYQGQVSHTRLQPRKHAFEYPIFMFYLWLEELEHLQSHIKGFHLNKRWGLACFNQEDHFPNNEKSLYKNIQSIIKEQTGDDYQGKIAILSHLRYCRFYFSPLNVYYCWDTAGTRILYTVAEVSNTPWLQKTWYVNTMKDDMNTEDTQKSFHVSPFLPMDMRYQWRFNQPLEKLLIGINNWRDDQLYFSASMKLKKTPLTTKNLMKTLTRYPIITVQIVVKIYWQAAKLWIKKIPYYPLPKADANSQSNVIENRKTHD
ncbi:MAG: DUF1365 domain-containing protein [Pseudomonadota bacterium]